MKKLLSSLLILAHIIVTPIQAMTAVRPVLQTGRRTLATNLLGQSATRSIALSRPTMGTLASKVQSKTYSNQQNKKSYTLLAGVSAAALGVGFAMQKKVYAHEETPNNGARLKYNDQTHRYQLLDGQFCFEQVVIPQDLMKEVRQALHLSDIDPDSITIIGFLGLPDGAPMSVLTLANGKRIITLNMSSRCNDIRFAQGFSEIARIFGFFHEAAHIKKQHNSKEKSLEQEEVEADLRAWITMNKHEATKEKLQQKMQYLFLKNIIRRPNMYLNQFEEVYYGLQILKNPKMNEQQEQALVNRVLQDRNRPNHQALIQNAVYQLVDAGELKVTEEVLNKELRDTKASSIRTGIMVGLLGWSATALLSIPAYAALPPLVLLVPTIAGINYYSETFMMQRRYNIVHQTCEEKTPTTP